MQDLRIILISIGILAIIVLLLYGGIGHYYKGKYASRGGPITVNRQRFKQWCAQLRLFKEWFDHAQCEQNTKVQRIHEPIFEPHNENVASALNVAFESTQFESVIAPASSVLTASSDSVACVRASDTNKAVLQAEYEKKAQSPSDRLLILYVGAHQKEHLQGVSLMRSLARLGCHYGEHSIFHRYLDANRQGPVLFSIANMVQPGTLDPKSMNEFTTPGVALFMTIATAGEPQQDFKLMLQAAQRLADDLSGVVLDDQRRMLTLQQTENYRARIRRLCTT